MPRFGRENKSGYSFSDLRQISEIEKTLNNITSDGSIIITKNPGNIHLQTSIDTSSIVTSVTISGTNTDYDALVHSKPWYTDSSARIIKAYNLADYETIPSGTVLLAVATTENPYVDTDGNEILDGDGETQSVTVYWVYPPVYLGP